MRFSLGCLLVFGAICPAAAQEDGMDFGMTGIMVAGGADKRRATAVLAHSPAADAGIEKGDTILTVDGVGAGDLDFNEFVARLRGKPGTEVNLVVIGHESGVAVSFTLKRVSYRAYHKANPSD